MRPSSQPGLTTLRDRTQERLAGWLLWLLAHGSTTKGRHVSDARLRWLTVILTAALVAVVGVGSLVGSSAAAASLQSAAETALADAGLDGVMVEFAGREATLSGGSHADLADATTVVEAIDGVRSVRAAEQTERSPARATTPAPSEAAGPSIVLRRSAGRVTISGVVPDADAAAEIKSGAALVFGGTVVGDLTVDGAAGTASWVTALPGIFGDVIGIRDLEIAIEPAAGLTLGGTIESAVGRRNVARHVSAAIPDVKIVNALTIDPAGLSKADATAINRSTVYFDQGLSVVSYAAVPSLNAIAEVLNSNPKLVLEIAGHTGPKDPAAGKRLTDERVAAVKAYLVAVGINADQLTTRAYSTEEQSGADPDAEQYRRVDFIVKGN